MKDVLKRNAQSEATPLLIKTGGGRVGGTGKSRKKLNSPAEYQTLKMIQPETK